MKMRIIPIITLIVLFTARGFSQQSQPENPGLIKWIDLKTAQELYKQQPKPIMIDMYTDWCGWCKHMMKTTFSNPSISNYINTYFYPVRFNAETKDTVEFQGNTYVNKNRGLRPAHDLAIMLMDSNMVYPTTVFFNNNYKFKLLAPGYLREADIEPLLVYSVEYIFNTTTAQDFKKYYALSFHPDSNFVSNDTLIWLNRFSQAVDQNKQQKRKTLMFVSTNWCYGGITMIRTTFSNSPITGYIRTHFNTLYMDAQSQDTIVYKDKTYTNEPGNQNMHPFLHEVLGQRVTLPMVLFFDEDMNYISVVNQYLTPENLNPIVHYFAGDIYKTKPWDVYIKEYQESLK